MIIHRAEEGRFKIVSGDCLEVMTKIKSETIDAIVTDPPYGLGFMGKEWDDLPPSREWAEECLRVLKPGGHLLAFGGTRTWHRLAVAIEDAGFEMRDSIAWLFGSGFPKSMDVSKAIDKTRDDKAGVIAVTSRLADLAEATGITRADLDAHMGTSDMGDWWLSRLRHRCACPSVENWARLRDFIPGAHELDAEVWRLNGRKGTPGEAWQTAEIVGQRTTGIGTGRGAVAVIPDGNRDLKAANSPEAARFEGWGTALKPAFEPIVVARKPIRGTVVANVLKHGTGALNIAATRINPGTPVTGGGGFAAHKVDQTEGWDRPYVNGVVATEAHAKGRWPSNVVLDESQAAALDEQSGTLTSGRLDRSKITAQNGIYGAAPTERIGIYELDSGGASRFYYVAKAPKKERPTVDGIAHPTVKPLALMRWLVRLVTPPGGTVLDPFAGSGTTVEAALLEGVKVLAIEREASYLPLIDERIDRQLALEGEAS